MFCNSRKIKQHANNCLKEEFSREIESNKTPLTCKVYINKANPLIGSDSANMKITLQYTYQSFNPHFDTSLLEQFLYSFPSNPYDEKFDELLTGVQSPIEVKS